MSIQITVFSRFVWTIFRKTPEKPKKVHTNLQKQAICMDFHKKLIIPCHSWIPHNCLAGRRAAAPLWPGVCPVPQGGGAVMGLAARYAALGSALDSTEELWHPSPKGVIRTAACQAAPTAGCEGGYHRGRATNSELVRSRLW